jgi:hypothetical protein
MDTLCLPLLLPKTKMKCSQPVLFAAFVVAKIYMSGFLPLLFFPNPWKSPFSMDVVDLETLKEQLLEQAREEFAMRLEEREREVKALKMELADALSKVTLGIAFLHENMSSTWQSVVLLLVPCQVFVFVFFADVNVN